MPVTADPNKTSTPGAVSNTSLGSALCTECGLCCTGAIHDSAALDSDEIEAAKALGLPVRDNEKPTFALPCPHLKGTMCSIYGSRPRACHRYKCQLLMDLEADDIDFDDALGKVVTAKALRRQAEMVMPEGMTLPQGRALAIALPSAPAGAADSAGRRSEMQLKLHTTALNLYLDKHFRNARDRKAFELNLVGHGKTGTEME